ncbi:MAG: hypothetical protein A2X49_06250 [Lentisphaerae bacterium GWF2_52_8]|nr:MAG: hypothetical protein A2X49_06250 [Lentisphaerae bacterium GWF2_52_8]
MNKESFRQCSCCKHEWASLDDFLSDPAIKLVGYQVNFGELELGFFLFNHCCKSTISMQVKVFSQLYGHPRFKNRLTGSSSCGGVCLKMDELGRCPNECECAYVREVMQIVQSWPKKFSASA